jgi:hypothetical protein
MSDTPDDEVQAAFPDRYRDGMTLRDYFAAQAMQGLLAADTGFTMYSAEISKIAYDQADAMMKAREA